MAPESNDIPRWKKSLNELLEGNERFVRGTLQHPRQSVERRAETAAKQQPKAAILACSDSRVSPEIIFDQGLGDIFVIRVAGNVLDDAVEGSLEYAVEGLKTPLILVMSHASCGAVNAAITSVAQDGAIGSILKKIEPAVGEASLQPGDQNANVAKAHAVRVVSELLSSGKPLAALAD